MKNLSMIVAVSDNGVIGDGDDMPWRQSGDLKRFKAITTSGREEGYQPCVIMGRKTHESIGMVLPKRENIVLTRNSDYEVEGVDVFNFKEAVLDHIHCDGRLLPFIIGGAEIYNLFLPHVEVLYLTRIHAIVPGDTKLDLDEILKDFTQIEKDGPHSSDEKNQYEYTFEKYVRV